MGVCGVWIGVCWGVHWSVLGCALEWVGVCIGACWGAYRCAFVSLLQLLGLRILVFLWLLVG